MIASLIFYLFAIVLVGSALMVISARNAVHSVLFLILAFFNAAGLFLILGAEFIASLVVIAYVGAVAVLFLFVVMMLNIEDIKRKDSFVAYMPVGLLVGMVLVAELAIVFGFWQTPQTIIPNMPIPDDITNTKALGNVLYTHYMLPFQVAGLILLVAMIGAITLTHRVRGGVRRQNPGEQVRRKQSDTIEIISVESGQGVNI